MPDTETYPTEPKRLKAFARFFKGYIGVSSVVTAALPIPATYVGLIPTYSFQTKLLSTYASLFCFLLLAFIFYIRHFLARLFFPDLSRERSIRINAAQLLITAAPFILILSSIVCVFLYQSYLASSVSQLRSTAQLSYADVSDKTLLERSDLSQVPGASMLMVYYLGIFLTAEAAFVLMAIKEYIQDVAHLSDFDLIREPSARTSDAPLD